MQLGLREIVVHGGFLAAGQGSGLGEADGSAGFTLVLPVASGLIPESNAPASVPLPSAVWLMEP